jgi:hypothetical protein
MLSRLVEHSMLHRRLALQLLVPQAASFLS